MQARYYIAMAHCVAEYRQSDYLYLMKLVDGRLIGASTEFEYGTAEVLEATKCEDPRTCDLDRHANVKWFGLTDELINGWLPATLTEIKGHGLRECVIGWKSSMKPSEVVQAIGE